MKETKTLTKYRKSERANRLAAGLCAKCKNAARPGRTLCAYHAEAYQVDAQKRKLKIAAYKRSIRNQENARKRTTEYKEKRNALRRAKKRSDPEWAMADRLRKRIGRAIRDYAPGMKLRKTQEYIGCSMDKFMRYIESKFLQGMNWDNRENWHLDHIRPCASFNLIDPEQQRLCFHYTNLQPLWSVDNMKKHSFWNGAIVLKKRT